MPGCPAVRLFGCPPPCLRACTGNSPRLLCPAISPGQGDIPTATTSAGSWGFPQTQLSFCPPLAAEIFHGSWEGSARDVGAQGVSQL